MARRCAAAVLVWVAGCSAATAPPKPTPGTGDRPTSPPGPRVIVLDDGTHVEIWPGVEPGFLHCCGDDQYILEIDCRQGVKRCYKPSRRGDWRHTYGRECKHALSQTCYLESCDVVCEAYWAYGDREQDDRSGIEPFNRTQAE